MTDAARVLSACRARGWQIATAESCTGGLVAAALTEVPGSSDAFERGFVTYSNRAKTELLGVRAATLEQFGAVSEQTALEMAEGALQRSGVDVAVSITGIAGPGGSAHKPEGLVCFGWATKGGKPCAETVHFGAIGRSQVRRESVDKALALLLEAAGT